MVLAEERFDVTARKVHQWTVVALTVLAFVLGGMVGGALMLFVGLVMVVGRYRDEADLFRLVYARLIVPTGLLSPRLIVEDRSTRRTARVLGGTAQILAGLAILAGTAVAVAWTIVGLITVMIVLDAAADFCALCFVVHQARRAA